ncbi:MAG: DUF2452 domain-containing protein [Bacteroidota bacterium]
MKEENKTTVKESFLNPIDKDKIAENPHLLPYAHTVGGAVIKPIDKGRVKGLAVTAMYEQTDMQLDQIRKQVELLAAQAEKIHKRVEVSERIYQAEINFKPIINHTYHLYENKKGKNVLSMIGPDEWGRSQPYTFIATVKMMADHTWDILVEE